MATLPLLPPEPDAPLRLVGIARLAADGTAIREGYGVEYRTLASRSILNRCTAAHMPFAWTVNPYRGCEFACKYCYARYTHEFMEMRDGLEFERKIYVKQDTARLLRRELRQVKPEEDIAIGTATDPYQPAEKRFEVTRGIVEVLAEQRGLNIGVVTKSQLILRDLELWKRVAEHNNVALHLTVTTMDTELARLLEPRAPRPDLRMDAVRKLSAAGITAGVICAPVLPGITDTLRNLEPLVRAAREHDAHYLFANPLFLKPCAFKILVPFLEEHFPRLVPLYRQRYGTEAYVSPAYRQQLFKRVSVLCQKYGLPDRDERRRAREFGKQLARAQSEQFSLF